MLMFVVVKTHLRRMNRSWEGRAAVVLGRRYCIVRLRVWMIEVVSGVLDPGSESEGSSLQYL